jgi:fucose permease
MKKFWKTNYAVIMFAFIFFIVGSENGGYQIALINITTDLELTETIKGVVVAMQYLAILTAPLIFGRLADRFGKKKITIIFFFIFLLGCLVITFSFSTITFIIGIFLVGTGIAITQTLVSAQLIDIYPESNSKRMTIAQIFYSIGAVVSPLIFNILMNNGMSWRYVFTTIGILCLIAIVGYSFLKNEPQEVVFSSENINENSTDDSKNSKLPVFFIALFIIIFMVYVGAETGLAFFVSSFMKTELNAEILAAGCISLFWGMQIVGRVLSVVFNKFKYTMLLICLVGMSVSIGLVGTSANAQMVYIYVGLAGLFCGPIFPLITSMGISFAPKKTATVAGFFVASTGVGGMLIPILVGAIGGSLGYRISFYFMGVFVLIAVGSYVLYLIKAKPNNKVKQL